MFKLKTQIADVQNRIIYAILIIIPVYIRSPPPQRANAASVVCVCVLCGVVCCVVCVEHGSFVDRFRAVLCFVDHFRAVLCFVDHFRAVWCFVDHFRAVWCFVDRSW